ncbi:electron transport complex subunit RsxC [Thauera propionica]|uniref:electron transport complex subunit RsxC n=1 Tax=Thauera propionica TaxID=2019431 RepID=UPI0023F34D3C|nr:electron transport complex subunit RsxC [Thauera propionica]MDD3674394.1 electron transport complex subunit RsxC [Thauera propionica]
MITRLFKFHGGIKPDAHKHESAGAPIRRAPLPSRLIVPLRQSTRATARCIVEVGQKVLKGQRIGEPEGFLGTAVHAPTSGTVVDFGRYTMAHASGLETRCVVIQPDGEDRWIEHAPFDAEAAGREATLAWLRDCGLVGLGGATFPSHVKLGKGSGVDTLILNGAECEPWITCDDRLMRERADGILAGARILYRLIGARELVIGIEDNKPEAIEAMRAAAQRVGDAVRIQAVPALYPAGGEKQLIRVLTGIEIPYGKLGADYGVQCFNVGTAHAVYRAIAHGEPLVSRIVTLTGNVARPGNWEVLIGTPIDELLPLAEPRPDTNRYLMGGPMMGFALPRLDVPVVKGSNCIISASPTLLPPPPPEQPCIRCTECAKACPAELQPFELYWFSRSKNFGKAQEYHLFDCIECGCCAYVCPSHIPLVDYYRFAKSEIWARERDKAAADQARERFEFRNYRQEREKEEKAAKLAAKAAETRAKLSSEAGEPAAGAAAAPAETEDPKKALIAAALARAQAQKAESQPRNTDNLSPETQAEIAQIEARRKAQAGDTPPPADGAVATDTPAPAETEGSPRP